MSDKYKSSPFFGWLTAGADLITAQLESAANTVSQRLDDTHEAFESMQVKGKQVETELCFQQLYFRFLFLLERIPTMVSSKLINF